MAGHGCRYVVGLPRSAQAAAVARSALSGWFADELDAGLLHRALLIASELATNAYLHGHGTIELRAELDENRLLVEVIDEGAGFEHEVRERDFERVGGRGLAIVEAEASRWGIREGTTHVWFELERAGPRLGARPKP